MGEQPHRNTVLEDIAAYQAERTIFLADKRQFEYGKLEYGIPAVNSLKSMYIELSYAIHQEKDFEASKNFIDDIYSLRDRIALAKNTTTLDKNGKAILTPNYMQLLKEMDGLHLRLQRFEKGCGF